MLDASSAGRRHDSGQVVLVVAAVVALVGTGVSALADTVVVMHARQRAQIAADAAALAAVVEGRSGAVSVAQANGARLAVHRLDAGEVVVEVETEVRGLFGEHRVWASARASDLP